MTFNSLIDLFFHVAIYLQLETMSGFLSILVAVTFLRNVTVKSSTVIEVLNL